MKRTIAVLSLTVCFAFSYNQSKAQYRDFEVGVIAGVVNYFGDIGKGLEARPFIYNLQWKFTRPGLNSYIRYNFNPNWALKANLIGGYMKADDALSESYSRRVIRNAKFESWLTEFSVQLEFKLLRKSLSKRNTSPGFDRGVRSRSKAARRCPTPGSGAKPNEIAVFILGGAGLMHFNPRAEYNGQMYNLRDLGTEGQFVAGSGKSPYSLNQFVIPLGLGFIYNAPISRFRIGFELGWRLTFTDYLDDVGGTFGDPVAIGAVNGDAAAYFANRTAEVSSNPDLDLIYSSPGMERGDNHGHNDSYFFSGITFAYSLSPYDPQKPKYKRNRFFLFGGR